MVKEKNWLIRTTNFQILGPVSKEKIIEFVNKGSLKGDDEVTSGNGYWFLVKEKDLLEKYVLGDVPQTFNPITEAPNILTANTSPDQTGTHSKIPHSTPSNNADPGDGALPTDGDLEYPDMNLPASDDLEYPEMGASSEPSGELSLDGLDTTPAPAAAPAASRPAEEVLSPEDELEGLLPDDNDLEYPDVSASMGDMSAASQDDFDEDTNPTNPAISEFDEETDPGIIPPDVEEQVAEEPALAAPAPAPARTASATPAPAKKIVTKPKATPKKREATKKKPQRNDRMLFMLTSIFFVTFLVAAVIFYYKKILNKPLPFIGDTVISVIMPTANAQTGQSESLVKKKAFLILKK